MCAIIAIVPHVLTLTYIITNTEDMRTSGGAFVDRVPLSLFETGNLNSFMEGMTDETVVESIYWFVMNVTVNCNTKVRCNYSFLKQCVRGC